MKIEHKIFEAEVKAFDDEDLIVENFISTEHKDRGGDIMRAKGMKIVGKPVVLMLHGRGPMGSEPVGKPLSITVGEFKGQPGILAKTQFFPDEVGRRLYAKIKGGFLPNWSIGYAVDEAKDLMESGHYAGRDVTKWQLLEYSPVGVPMNPFAQTIKEWVDWVDENPKGKTFPGELRTEADPAWFGVVEEKTCTGCGACHGSKGECTTCKGLMTYFAEGQDFLGKACEKCQPEEFARLKNGIASLAPPPDNVTDMKCATCGEPLRKKWGGEAPPYKPEKVYCKAGCEIVVKTSEGGFMMQHRTLKGLLEAVYAKYKEVKGTELEISEIEKFKKEAAALGITLSDDPMKAIDERIATLEVQWKAMEGSFNTLYDCHVALDKKFEPLLKTLPPEPEGGKEGDEEHHDNPPEKKTPRRLVIVREEETPEGKQQAKKAQILAVAREAIGEAVKQEIDRMKGRVP